MHLAEDGGGGRERLRRVDTESSIKLKAVIRRRLKLKAVFHGQDLNCFAKHSRDQKVFANCDFARQEMFAKYHDLWPRLKSFRTMIAAKHSRDKSLSQCEALFF